MHNSGSRETERDKEIYSDNGDNFETCWAFFINVFLQQVQFFGAQWCVDKQFHSLNI